MTRKGYGILERSSSGLSTHTFRELKAHERCLLMRRRCNMTQAEVAAQSGYSRYHINRMEQGLAECTALVCFWEC